MPKRNRAARTVVIASALLAGLATAVVGTGPAEARAADTLFPSQGNPGYQVRSYDVSLRYAPATNHLDATAVIRASAGSALSSFHLDLSGLQVGSVTVDGERARWTRSGHELVITPAQPVSGRFTTTVRYAGSPRAYTDADGSREGWLRTSDGATALGQPVGTMTWLPCNNTPGDKARFTFRITVPNTRQAAANGDLVARHRHATTTTWVWRSREPMSTFLATVSIGRFDIYRSSATSVTGRTIPIWTFVDPTTPIPLATRRAIPAILRFQEKRFGPYPFSSAGMIVDDVPVGYALETQTRPVFPGRVGLHTLVHELAHQWYGNSVTVRDWHDIWLAEGFATYAEWWWNANHGGRTPAEEFADLYTLPANDGLWSPAPTQFTSSADLFGTPVYDRGAMTLQALRVQVGNQAFFDIMRGWAQDRRHGSGTTAAFIAHAESVSGQQLDQLFADWLELDGKPTGY